jgi:hypothetical protein
MANSNLKVDLYPRKDSHKNTYYVGKLKFDGNIRFENGITFLVFISDDGNEQLQITQMDQDEKGSV